MKDLLEAVILFAIGIGAALAMAIPAKAQQCWEPKTAERMLEEGWNEVLTNYGVNSQGGLVRLYQNRETGTWTLTVVHGPHMECALTAGQDWRDRDDRQDEGA